MDPKFRKEQQAKRKKMRKKPGSQWRVLAWRNDDHWGDENNKVAIENDGVFDELCVDDWLHLEQMDDRSWFLSVGERAFWIDIPKDHTKPVSITLEEQRPDNLFLNE